MAKIPRPARPKQGELKAKWARHEGSDDIVFSWGDDVPAGAGRMLYSVVNSKSYSQVSGKWEPSFLEVLENWGFDLKTLKISITHGDFTNDKM